MGSGRGGWRRELDEQFRKNQEFTFEACKHFTTLTTAAALIEGAILKDTDAGLPIEFVAPMVLFGVSLVLCAYGMLATTLGGLGANKAAIATGSALLMGAVFFFALMLSVLAALSHV